MMRKLKLSLPFAFISLYIVLAFAKLRFPGVNYDEIFFGNAAFGGTADSTFVKIRFYGVPLFILEYIGALKAWLYAPIFRLFGISVWSIRIPMILLSALSLYFLYRFAKEIWGNRLALLTLAFTATDPIFVSMTRVDFGPVAISFFFRVLALNLFFAFLRSKKTKYVFWLTFVLFLAWFNKMDFIWFILALLVSSLFFYGRDLSNLFLKRLETKVRVTGLVFILVFVCVFGFIASKFGFFSTIDFFYFSHLVHILDNTLRLLNGTYFYNLIYSPLNNPLLVIYSIVLIVLIILNSVIELRLNAKGKIEYFFLLVLAGLIYFQIIITSKAGAPWHLIYLNPFVELLLARSVMNISDLLGKKAQLIALPIISLIIGYQLFINSRYLISYGKSSASVHWSYVIYDLIDYARRSNHRFVSVDWGTHNQLLDFDYQRGKYFDEWPRFAQNPIPVKDKIFLIYGHYMDSRSLFVLHSSQKTEFMQTRINFFKIAHDLKMEPKLVKAFYDGSSVVYEIYKVEPGLTGKQ